MLESRRKTSNPHVAAWNPCSLHGDSDDFHTIFTFNSCRSPPYTQRRIHPSHHSLEIFKNLRGGPIVKTTLVQNLLVAGQRGKTFIRGLGSADGISGLGMCSFQKLRKKTKKDRRMDCRHLSVVYLSMVCVAKFYQSRIGSSYHV